MCGDPEIYLMRTAQGKDELAAVRRFRYEHFFKDFPEGYPGLDHAGCCVSEPHDPASVHHCAFDSEGELCAVSTATSSDAAEVPPQWRQWFQIDALRRAGLDKIVVSTQMVIRADHRSRGVLEMFHRFIINSYIEAGFEYALHYCSPEMVGLFEKLGHRAFGELFEVAPGFLRAPMLMVLKEPPANPKHFLPMQRLEG